MKLIIHNPEIAGNKITATYSVCDTLFTHEFLLPVDAQPDDQTVKTLVKWLCIIHSVYLFTIEYFDQIETDFDMSTDEIGFFEKVIYNGMAEFRHTNTISINTFTKITPKNTKTTPSRANDKQLSGRLLLNGGGKDGLTSAILLGRAGLDFDLFQVGTGKSQTAAARSLGKKAFVFHRLMDNRRFKQKYHGHFPTSAAISISSVLCAYLLGKAEVIASNETSANEMNMEIDGVKINHQYSKSFEFESDFSSLLSKNGVPVRYFSLLRPLHELQIAKIFLSEPQYSNSFISCNHGFRQGFWCLKCAKCAFICLMVNAISPSAADNIFKVNDSINLPELYDHIIALIEPQTDKPLECVGTLEECQIAAKIILNNPNVQLNERLKTAMAKYAGSISGQQIHDFITTTSAGHNIPSPEYDQLLQIIKTELENN